MHRSLRKFVLPGWALGSVSLKTPIYNLHHLIPRRNNRANMTEQLDNGIRVWLVERTYSDDEQNLIILTYATPDGEQYYRKERALTSFTDVRDTTAAVDADPNNLGSVDDTDLQEQYATEAQRMQETHDHDDVI